MLHDQAAHDQAGGNWDEEWVRVYSAQERSWQGYGQRRQQRTRRESGGSWYGQSAGQGGQWSGWGDQERTQGAPAGPPPGGSRDPQGYYRALGVDPDASQEDIQSSFRGLALRHHPDRVTGDSGTKAAAAERMKAINEAYAVLRNPSKRRAYDAGFGG